MLFQPMNYTHTPRGNKRLQTAANDCHNESFPIRTQKQQRRQASHAGSCHVFLMAVTPTRGELLLSYNSIQFS